MIHDTEEADVAAMRAALECAREAEMQGEAPVGAVIVNPADGQIVARAHNQPITLKDPTAHAEVLAIRAAAQIVGNYRLTGFVLYCTLEPCAMCAGAVSHARLRRVVYAASDPKGGAVEHGPRFFAQPTCHHRPETRSGLLAEDSAALLRRFFRARRGDG